MLGHLWRNMPDVVKNLVLLNILMFVATAFLSTPDMDLTNMLGLHYPDSPEFEPYQLVTYMFMHGGIGHIFFNMFALLMFGSQLERVWGPKRFLIFYLVTGLGAMVLHLGVQAYQIYEIFGTISPVKAGLLEQTSNGLDFTNSFQASVSNSEVKTIVTTYLAPTVGASGAIFGLLIGFAMLFPNTELMLMFIPIPIKAKYFVPFYMVVELYLGVNNFEWDNIAHFAHLGGALFGFILVMIWKRDRSQFY
jgi:rhomboid-like protein